MKLHTIDTGFFKLDGGAMFGVVPKTIWQKVNPPDENNLCNWAMRCLLVETGNRLILIDNGFGDKQEEKFTRHYYRNGDDTLEKSLKKAGFSPADITDMFLTHLHFDHCGGSIQFNKNRTAYETAFPNATYWINEEQWNWATVNPNPREKASYLKENLFPIQERGQLKLFSPQNPIFDGFDLEFVYGHTEGMVLPKINYKGNTILYMADLMPSIGHINPAYVMAYDVRPLNSMDEKAKYLKLAADNNWLLYFEHDPVNEGCKVEHTDRGIKAGEVFRISEL